jgi:hypothetical protein
MGFALFSNSYNGEEREGQQNGIGAKMQDLPFSSDEDEQLEGEKREDDELENVVPLPAFAGPMINGVCMPDIYNVKRMLKKGEIPTLSMIRKQMEACKLAHSDRDQIEQFIATVSAQKLWGRPLIFNGVGCNGKTVLANLITGYLVGNAKPLQMSPGGPSEPCYKYGSSSDVSVTDIWLHTGGGLNLVNGVIDSNKEMPAVMAKARGTNMIICTILWERFEKHELLIAPKSAEDDPIIIQADAIDFGHTFIPH